VVGEDISVVNWGFVGNQNTFASRGQKAIYWGPLKPLEKFLLRTTLAPWSYVASKIYHDLFWYPLYGKARVKKIYNSKWGKLFKNYEHAQANDAGFENI
jgi:hypothetical protein